MADNKELTLDELLAKEAETHSPEIQCKLGEYYQKTITQKKHLNGIHWQLKKNIQMHNII